jgi:Ca2+-binding EF-hand superfamily protein
MNSVRSRERRSMKPYVHQKPISLSSSPKY